jgi:hypothetical protein
MRREFGSVAHLAGGKTMKDQRLTVGRVEQLTTEKQIHKPSLTRDDLRAMLSGTPSKYPDFLVIGAFRYALGRQTYVTSDTSEWIIANWEALTIKCRSVISRDLDEAIASDNKSREGGEKYGDLGADIDRAEWMKLSKVIKAEKLTQTLAQSSKSG